jgi:hypothetical protein
VDEDAGFRSVALPQRRVLTVRPMRDRDAEALGKLYEGLSLDDRYRRFFSVYHPTRNFLEHYASTAGEKGYGLVAVVGNGADQLVGEATYTLLPSGCGEFAITIARGHAHDRHGLRLGFDTDARCTVSTKWPTNQSRASALTASRAPGSSNRWVAPGTISM